MTVCYPIQSPPQDTAPPRRMPRTYLWLAGLAMASGSVVMMEPAPYDIALVLLLVAGVLLNRLAFQAIHRVPLLFLCGFLAANVVSLAFADDLRTGILYTGVNAYMAATWLFFVGMTSAHGSRGVQVLMRGYTLAGSLAVALSSLAFFGVIHNQPLLLGAGRAQGLFKDPNVYGPYLVPMLVYALMRLQGRRPRDGGFWWALVVCIISALGVFLSFSRAAWINCGVAVVCFLGLQFVSGIIRQRVSVSLLYSLLLVGLLAGGVAFLSASGESAIGRMLAMRVREGGLQNYDSMRFYTHRLALETVKERPLGIGPGQSELVFQYATHSMYLRILAEDGVLGFAAFYGFVLLSLLRASKQALTRSNDFERNLFAVVSACVLGILINGLVIDTIHWRHLWFLLGLACWVPRTSDDREAVES